MIKSSNTVPGMLTPGRRTILEVFAAARPPSRVLDRRGDADVRDGVVLGAALLLVVLLMALLCTLR